jgi:hypothetical protein
VFCGEGCTTPISAATSAGFARPSVDPCQYRSLTTRPMMVLPILPPEQYQYRRLGAGEYSGRVRSLQVPVVKQAVQNSCGPDSIRCRDDCCGTATAVFGRRCQLPATRNCLLRNAETEWEWYLTPRMGPADRTDSVERVRLLWLSCERRYSLYRKFPKPVCAVVNTQSVLFAGASCNGDTCLLRCLSLCGGEVTDRCSTHCSVPTTTNKPTAAPTKKLLASTAKLCYHLEASRVK